AARRRGRYLVVREASRAPARLIPKRQVMAKEKRVKQRRRTRLGVTKGSPAAAARRKKKDSRKTGVRTSRKQRDIRYAGGVRKVRKAPRKSGERRAPGATAARRASFPPTTPRT